MKKKYKYVPPSLMSKFMDNLSDLLKDYVTEDDLKEALSGLIGIDILRVDTFEALMKGYQSGSEEYKSTSTIYLVGSTDISDEGEGSTNHYEEYLYLGSRATEARPYEYIGGMTTQIDLSSYVQEDDLEEMSELEFTEMWKEYFPDEE